MTFTGRGPRRSEKSRSALVGVFRDGNFLSRRRRGRPLGEFQGKWIHDRLMRQTLAFPNQLNTLGADLHPINRHPSR